MSFGLMNSGATFTRMMRKLLKDVHNVEHYIDDCLRPYQDMEKSMSKTLLQIFTESERSKVDC